MSKEKTTPVEGTKKEENKIPFDKESRNMLCDRLNFAASEAYKLLRTNLTFTLPADKNCRIVGVTSAIRGEGKTTTSINLSYTQAETGKKTLLIDADMRLPSVAKKLGIPGKPGLSDVLVGLCSFGEAVQTSELIKNWHILPSGNIPPNPSELLGGDHMKALLQECAKIYDTIIIDLPPVNIVADALTIADQVDGLLLVVRENYIDKNSLNDCMRQMSFLEKGKLLGFVLTDTGHSGSRYYRYGRYGKYGKYGKYKRYGYKYGYKYGKKYGYGKYGYGKYGYEKAGGHEDYETVWTWQHQANEPEETEAVQPK